MNRVAYVFAQEPRDALYRNVLEAGLTYCNQLGLVIYRRDYESSAQEILESLTPFLTEMKDVHEWPGSRLAHGYTARLGTYQYLLPVKEFLELATDGLFEWQNPDLPDDPHLLREDGSTWLGSTAHEEVAWLEFANTGEFEEFGQMYPDIAASLRPE